MDSGSVHRLVIEDHNRSLGMKFRWDGQDWKISDVSYWEYVGSSSIVDTQTFELIKKLHEIQGVVLEQQRTNSIWNWMFVPPGEENKDLYVRFGTIYKRYVSCGIRIGCYNFVEIEVVGERDLVMLFPGSDDEIKFKAGEKRIHRLVTHL